MAFSTSFVKLPALAAQRPASRAARMPLRVRAEETTETKTPTTEGPSFSFSSNENAGLGYVEEDSAGQTNIFAVQPKQYVQGSAYDESDPNANLSIALAGSIFGLLLVGIGVTALSTQGGDSAARVDFSEYAQYESLSSYKAKFEKREVVEAPAVEATPELTE